MKTSDFDFDLPRELIAQHPAAPRDSARLLEVTPANGAPLLADRGVRDLPACLRSGDLLVFNDTRVIPARLTGRRGAARVEVTLHLQEGPATWRAFARPARRLKPGDEIVFADGFAARVEAKGEGGEVTLAFGVEGAELMQALERFGAMPLPPYIRREGGADPHDAADYQTIFAKRPGAVAAPTAGLHFTDALLDALAARGVNMAGVTLHVGAGTFLPVTVEDVAQHRMHAEWGEVGAETCDAIARARAAGGRIVAVGTTSLRLIESAAADDGTVRPFADQTSLFITPGYRFKAIDLLLTNFHLPKSTLFMLVCAFAGTETMKAAYAHARDAGYRFYSYGDACLLHRMG